MNFANALGWTLVHFVWEGALIVTLFAVLQLFLKRASANLRYLTGCAAMLLMLIAPLLTLLGLAGHGPATGAGLAVAAHRANSFSKALPVLIVVWLAGVVLLSAWSAGGWVMAQRLRRKCRSRIPVEWEGRMERLRQAVGVRRTIRVFQSALTDVPLVVGWIRPVILVPVCALTNINVLQLEALLAHELAHIRRHDYLVNLMQTAVETLLYYHPAVWWLGRRIREEREHCCDDIAVAVCGSTLVYASALANLEENRVAAVRLAMAASNGSLVSRIQRLAAVPRKTSSGAPGWLIALIVSFGLVMTLSGSAQKARNSRDAAAMAQSSYRGSFVGGLAAAGYNGISVDEIIALKQSGVSPEYLKAITTTGIGKPSPNELIQLHQNGVSAKNIERAKDFAPDDLSVSRLIQLKQSGLLSGKGN